MRSLGLGKYEEDLFYKMRSMAVGLNVVAGPTGSGKSTTLQRNLIKLLQEKNYQINLLTVDGSARVSYSGRTANAGYECQHRRREKRTIYKSFVAALRSDPDVILVGETRSLSTAELTFKGALSGHGVWTTLHANSAPAIVTRLRDMGIQPYLLNDPELVKGLVSQRLFRKLCPNCRQSIKTKEGTPEFERLRNALGDYGIENVYVSGPAAKPADIKDLKAEWLLTKLFCRIHVFCSLMIDNETPKPSTTGSAS